MAIKSRNDPGDEPARQAHLDDDDERAALLEWDKGTAEIVWLCHGVLHRFVTGAKDAIVLAGRPIASSQKRSLTAAAHDADDLMQARDVTRRGHIRTDRRSSGWPSATARPGGLRDCP